jgi:poly(hydroxyalkanoate) depolymerase family esterase
MHQRLNQAMYEVTQLTRAGRLSEAAALIQRSLRGDTAAAPSNDDAAPVLDLVAETIEAESPLDPSQGTFRAHTYLGAAGRRDYKLYVPSGGNSQPLPLLVMLHGCTQSPDDFAAGTRMNVLAEEQTCLVVYPAQPASANHSKCWNWFRTADQQRDVGEPALIAGITRQVMRDHAVDSRRVYIAGLSAGGAAAAIMGATYPDLYAAIGVHSGLACGAAGDLASAFSAMQSGQMPGVQNRGNPRFERGGRAIVFHGDRDTTVNPRNADHVVAQALANSRTEPRVRVERGQIPGGHAFSRSLYVDSTGSTIVERWVIHCGSHAWSGGSSAGSCTDPRGPDASREMLRFFLEEPRA